MRCAVLSPTYLLLSRFFKNNKMVLFEAPVSVDILLNKQGGILTTQDLNDCNRKIGFMSTAEPSVFFGPAT